MIPEHTLDLIDFLANRQIVPCGHQNRAGRGRSCVAVKLPWDSGYTPEDLPLHGQIWDEDGIGKIVYWPEHAWTDEVQRYVDSIFDSSGESLDEQGD